MRKKWMWLLVGLLLLAGLGALAQQVIQSGKPIPGHAAKWITNLTIGDVGPANGGPAGTGLSELNITSTLNNGSPFCINDAPTTGGFHQLCLGADALGGGLLSYNAYGGAPPLPLQCQVNGVLGPCLSGTPPPPAGLLADVVLDPRNYGASCGNSDSTAAIQAAVNAALAAHGGRVVIPCPLTVAGEVTIGTNGMQGNVRLTGAGPMYMPLQNVNSAGAPGSGSGTMVWPPPTGPAIVCTSSTVAACIMVNAAGVEIDHVNFGNIQPTPPTSGTWNPTLYPWVIGTASNTGWQGLNIHDVTFTSTSQAIDLEGTSDYTTWTGTQITLDHIWCNPCLNTGVRIHNIDNQQFYSRIMFVPSGYYMNYGPVGAYLRANAIGFDIQYSAAPQFHDINFFANKAGFQFRNGSVTNNFGTLTFAASAFEATNIMFNNACQAITMPNGNGTWLNFGKLVNVDVWGDQSGFKCSAGKAMFDLPTNAVDLSLSHVNMYAGDTFMNIGCGTPGTGSCPAGGSTGSPSVRLYDVESLLGYGQNTAGAPFMKATSNSTVFMVTDVSHITPAAGAGNIMAPGLDGTQAYMATVFVGGGVNPVEGSVGLVGSGSLPTESGFVEFFTPDHSERGWVGGCVTGTNAGCSLSSVTGSIYLKPNSATTASFGLNSGKSIVNLGALPTSCAGQVTGTIWVNAGVLTACP